MRVIAHLLRPGRILFTTWIVAVGSASGCYAPQARDIRGSASGLVVLADPVPSEGIATSPAAVVVEAPRSQDAQTLATVPSSVETWIVHTRACSQKLGSDPWSSINIGLLDDQGGPVHGADPEALLSRMTGRPSVLFVHGAGYTYQDAVDEGVKIRAVLEANGGFSPETLFVIFDWPSERERGDFIQDLNEESRRSRVAAYHFARFLQTTAPGSRICLLGQSNGGRIVLSTMHLLSGAPMRPFWNEPEVQLTRGAAGPPYPSGGSGRGGRSSLAQPGRASGSSPAHVRVAVRRAQLRRLCPIGLHLGRLHGPSARAGPGRFSSERLEKSRSAGRSRRTGQSTLARRF